MLFCSIPKAKVKYLSPITLGGISQGLMFYRRVEFLFSVTMFLRQRHFWSNVESYERTNNIPCALQKHCWKNLKLYPSLSHQTLWNSSMAFFALHIQRHITYRCTYVWRSNLISILDRESVVLVPDLYKYFFLHFYTTEARLLKVLTLRVLFWISVASILAREKLGSEHNPLIPKI